MAHAALKFWLYAKIGNEDYPGLVWENHAEMTFRLPWVREKEPGWERCYKLFHDWLERDSKPRCEHSTAKSNFRTALNNSKYFKKIKEEKQQMGSYNIYRFCNTTHEEMTGANQQPVDNGCQAAVVDESNITVHQAYREQVQVPMGAATDEWVYRTNLVPDCGGHANNESQPLDDEDCGDILMPSIPSLDDEQITLNKLFAMGISSANQQPVDDGCQAAVVDDSNITVHQAYREQVKVPMGAATDEWVCRTNLVPDCGGHANNESQPLDDEVCGDILMPSIPSLDDEQITLNKLFAMGISREDLSSCEYSIEYMGRFQTMGCISNMEENSKFIYGDDANALAVETVNIKKNSPYFSNQLYELVVPLNIKSEKFIEVLKNMNTGISIWFDLKDLCIKTVRHCRTHLFSFDVVGSNDCPILLARDQPYTIFSYKQFLFDHTSSSTVPEITPPETKIELIAGPQPVKKGASAKGVKIVLKPCGALKLLNCDDLASLRDLCLSLDSSSLDRELRAMNLGGRVANV